MLETNRIYCIDCLEGMKQLEDNSVDLTITSPPYNAGTNIRGNFYEKYDDNLDEYICQEFISRVLKELIRVTKNYVFFNFQLLTTNKNAYLHILSEFKEGDIHIFYIEVLPNGIEPYKKEERK